MPIMWADCGRGCGKLVREDSWCDCTPAEEIAEAQKRIYGERSFSILTGETVRTIPWRLVEPHEQTAIANHYQSLQTLNVRGGLSPQELYCVLKDLSLKHIYTVTKQQAEEYIRSLL